MSVALSFNRVSKRFVLQHERSHSFQERFVGLFRRGGSAEEFWALDDVTFDVRDGQTFGILGRNGAGKSTLLKLATGILEPTRGSIRRLRRTYAMLELGAGFHPELSGRDNIFLNGSIHGLSRAEMRRLFDRIVDFSELEQFIDTPLKHYSSGMYMRLGFATAIHMNPELLIIDEILAVGDAAFGRKCNEALWGLKRQGVTILFVSHNEDAVYQFCDRALLLAHGRIAAMGDTDDVVSAYARMLEADHHAEESDSERLTVLAVTALDATDRETLTIPGGQPWALELALRVPLGGGHLNGEVVLHADTGSQVLSVPLDCRVPDDGVGLLRPRVAIAPAPLNAGRFRVNVKLAWTDAAGTVRLAQYESPRSLVVADQAHGPLLVVPFEWSAVDGAPAPESAGEPFVVGATTYLPEVLVAPDGETTLWLANPHLEPVAVELVADYAANSGGRRRQMLQLEALAAVTLNAADVFGRGREYALRVESERPILVERLIELTAYPSRGGLAYGRPQLARLHGLTGASLSAGAALTAEQWWSAEGYTGPGFDVYLVVQNPNDVPAEVQLDYLTEQAETVRRLVHVPVAGRVTVPVHDADEPAGLGPERIFGVALRGVDGVGLVVERVTYCTYQGVEVRATALVSGLAAAETARRWCFADCAAPAGVDAYLTLLNPGDAPAQVTIDYLGEAGSHGRARTLALPAGGKATVHLHDPVGADNPGGLGRDAACGAVVAATRPIVVEQVRYAAATSDAGTGNGLARVGQTTGLPGDAVAWLPPCWYAVDGSVELHVLNPAAEPVTLAVALLGAAGNRPLAEVTVPGRHRRSLGLPAPPEGSLGWLVWVTSDGPAEPIVELSRSALLASGRPVSHVAAAQRLPACLADTLRREYTTAAVAGA